MLARNYIYVLFSAILFLIVLFSLESSQINKYNRKYFISSAVSNIAVLLSLICRDLSREINLRNLHIITNIIIYGLAPLIPFFLCTMHLHRNKIARILLSIPAMIIFIIAISSTWSGLLFYVDASNAYRRGILYPVSFAIIFAYFIGAIVLNLRTHRDIEKTEKVWLITIFGIVSAGGVLQTLDSNIHALWPTAAATLIMYYVFMLESAANYDVLTNVRNRNSFFAKKSKLTTDTAYSVMIYDINHLKKANDNIGHAVGDVLIMDTARILSNVFYKTGTPFRIGGDEFCVIVNSTEEDKLSEINVTIMNMLGQHNETSDLLLSISFGHEIHRPQDKRTFEEIFEAADANMYKMKKSHRSNF